MNLGWTDGNWTLHFDEMKLGDAGAAYFMHSLRRILSTSLPMSLQ